MSGLLAVAAAAVAAILAIVVAASRAWAGWLDLERLRLLREPGMAPAAGARIELADLRERVRRLEAIAAGIEL